MKDWKLAVGILVMVVIDLIILIPYSVMEGLEGSVRRQENRENPFKSDEVCMLQKKHAIPHIRCLGLYRVLSGSFHWGGSYPYIS